jgi:hypothetical protein
MDNFFERIAAIKDPLMLEYLALSLRCGKELGAAPPPRRFQTREDRIDEMRQALAAGVAPGDWTLWGERRRVWVE